MSLTRFDANAGAKARKHPHLLYWPRSFGLSLEERQNMSHRARLSMLTIFLWACAVTWAQGGPPNVSQVVMWSTLTSGRTIQSTPNTPFTPNVTGTLPRSLLSVYTEQRTVPAANTQSFVDAINQVESYGVANSSALARALSANIAVTLSAIPLESPTSGVILKTDPATGAALPVNSTLGPIFTQRAETIGKRKFYIGFTHQNYHFSSLNGRSLNGLSVMYGGGDTSGITLGGTPTSTAPATINMGLDVRLSQDVAFLTYGVTNRLDVSVGLPVVHAAVSSTAYNGVIYSGTGTDFNPGNQCWCVNTFTPGTFSLTAPQIGQASYGKTGFGDMLIRVKGTVIERSHMVMAVGTDLRAPTGDEANFLGVGTASVKPFVAASLYTTPLAHGIVFAPHFDAGWQFSGSSILAGTLQGKAQTAQISGVSVPYFGAPLVSTKGTLPDIFSWAVGTEVALGRRNTFIVDFLGNQIGWINGVETLKSQSISSKFSPPSDARLPQTYGLIDAGKGSFGQYSGAFGYKVKLIGNLIGSFQALLRFDNNGLVARVTPLYGLGYSF